MALPATDNFTGTNGQALSARTGWTVNAGSFAIQSNSLRPSAAATESGARWSGDSFSADQYAQCLIVGTEAGRSIGVAVRVSTSGAQTWYGVYLSSSTIAQFFKNVAGTWTQLGSDITGWANGQTMRIEAEGTTIRVLRNGVQVASATDSAIANGAPGVGGWHSSTTSLIDDWEGGNLGGGGGANLPAILHHLQQQGIAA